MPRQQPQEDGSGGQTPGRPRGHSPSPQRHTIHNYAAALFLSAQWRAFAGFLCVAGIYAADPCPGVTGFWVQFLKKNKQVQKQKRIKKNPAKTSRSNSRQELFP